MPPARALRCDRALLAQLDALEIGPCRTARGDALLGRAELPDATALAERFSDAVLSVPATG